MRDFLSTAKKPELLAPAGSPALLKTAVRYGADAVYIGGEAFSLRSEADNATTEELADAVRYAHDRHVRVYVTANILARNTDLSEAAAYFQELRGVSPDALIISDPGLFTLARKILPETDLHVSTQANNLNYGTFRFWHELGARRVVAARDLSLAELREIRANIPEDLEIEAFVHGSMCMAYSGRCLLSEFLTGRDANRGACAHPCRYSYRLEEESRPGEYFPIEENARGTYILSARDLCMIDHLPDLVEAGVDSLKIEGRMKTALYVATVTRAYRQAIDDLFKDPETYAARLPHYRAEVEKCTVRAFSTGFFYGRPESGASDGTAYQRNYVYLGTVEAVRDGRALFTQKNKFLKSGAAEIMKPDGRDVPVTVLSIRNAEGEETDSAPHAGEALSVAFSTVPEAGDVLRVPIKDAAKKD